MPARQRGDSRTVSEEEAMVRPPTQAESCNPEAVTGEEETRIMLTSQTSSRFKHRFLRTGKRKVGVYESLKNIVLSSWLNMFIIFIPISWVAHFSNERNKEDPERIWPFPLTFALSFLAIVPLEKLFEYGGEQMALYCGKDLGDLIIISLNNVVEATLAIILLTKCEIKVLQSTIVGVIILHLLLIPGTAFLVGGARIRHQDLHPHSTELNHTLLTIGVLTLLLPAAFFSALDRGAVASSGTSESLINDATRNKFIQMSRGLALILLTVYICSRIYLHNPPGDNNAFLLAEDALQAAKAEEARLDHEEPEVGQWVCIAMLIVTIALMAITAEWLVDSIEFVRQSNIIQEEWFGLILLPIVSFSADGVLAVMYFIRYTLKGFFGNPPLSSTIASARGIDLSIQFTLFWMPFIVLLGWWISKPLPLLFDLFEVALVIASCFIVNYVTADAKTNWAEGYAMVAFYVMIALCSWFYTGQEELEELLEFGKCVAAVAADIQSDGVGATE